MEVINTNEQRSSLSCMCRYRRKDLWYHVSNKSIIYDVFTVIGGKKDHSSHTNSGECYDPETDRYLVNSKFFFFVN